MSAFLSLRPVGPDPMLWKIMERQPVEVRQAAVELRQLMETIPHGWSGRPGTGSLWTKIWWSIYEKLKERAIPATTEKSIIHRVQQIADDVLHQGYLNTLDLLSQNKAWFVLKWFVKRGGFKGMTGIEAMLGEIIPANILGPRSGIQKALNDYRNIEARHGESMPIDTMRSKVKTVLNQALGYSQEHLGIKTDLATGRQYLDETVAQIRSEPTRIELMYEANRHDYLTLTGSQCSPRMFPVLEDMANALILNPEAEFLDAEDRKLFDALLIEANGDNITPWAYLWHKANPAIRMAMAKAWNTVRLNAHRLAEEQYRYPVVTYETVSVKNAPGRYEYWAVWRNRQGCPQRQWIGRSPAINRSKALKFVYAKMEALAMSDAAWEKLTEPRVGIFRIKSGAFCLAWGRKKERHHQYLGHVSRSQAEILRRAKQQELLKAGVKSYSAGVPRLDAWPSWRVQRRRLERNGIRPRLCVQFADAFRTNSKGTYIDPAPPTSHKPVLRMLNKVAPVAKALQVVYYRTPAYALSEQANPRCTAPFKPGTRYAVQGSYTPDPKTGKILIALHGTTDTMAALPFVECLFRFAQDMGRVLEPDRENACQRWLERQNTPRNSDDWFTTNLAMDFLRKPQNRSLPKRIFNHYTAFLTGEKNVPEDIGQRVLSLYPAHGYRIVD